MQYIIENYLKTNYIGSHCTSTSLRNILAYNGYPYTEDLCFGLGGGLGFSFYKISEMQSYSFSGRARNIERLLCKNLGIESKQHYNFDNETMWDYITKSISQGQPILVKLDINELEYMRLYFKINEKIELSEHMGVVVGIGKEKALISEYYKKKPIEIEKTELLKSMNSKFEDKALYNIFYNFNFPTKLIDLRLALANSIYYNSHEMINGFGSSLGLPGLVKFIEEIFRWPNIMSMEDLKRNAYMAYVAFEKIGTGGGNFRQIYARFLKQTADILNSDYINEIANEYAMLARYWKMFAKELYNLALTENTQILSSEGELRKLCLLIKNKEKENTSNLYEWALKYYGTDIDLKQAKVIS